MKCYFEGVNLKSWGESREFSVYGDRVEVVGDVGMEWDG